MADNIPVISARNVESLQERASNWIRKVKKGSDLLVRDPKLGAALAKTLGKLPRCRRSKSLHAEAGLQARVAAVAREGAGEGKADRR